jgi:hypothetical protein
MAETLDSAQEGQEEQKASTQARALQKSGGLQLRILHWKPARDMNGEQIEVGCLSSLSEKAVQAGRTVTGCRFAGQWRLTKLGHLTSLCDRMITYSDKLRLVLSPDTSPGLFCWKIL